MFPKTPHDSFPHAPLKVMLGQVKFPRLASVGPSGPLSPFHDAIRDRFPDFGEDRHIFLALGGGAAQQQSEITYRFANREHNWAIVLAPDALTIEATGGSQYTSYADFVDNLEFVWQAFSALFRPEHVLRIGLRYVDHIEGVRSPQEWREWINPELMGAIGNEPFNRELSKALTELQLSRHDGIFQLRHGIQSAGPENVPGYLLDFDYYSNYNLEPNIDKIIDVFDAYHSFLYDCFSWCVTEKARESFR